MKTNSTRETSGQLPGDDLALLRDLIRRIESGSRQSRRSKFIPSGLPRLDATLPGGGLPTGTLAEILYQEQGTGALSLAVRWTQQALIGGGHAVFVESPETNDALYPPALVQAGLPVERVVVIRPDSRRDAIWACDQSLRCGGVSAVVVRYGGFRHLPARVWRLFQLAAEAGEGIGLILRACGEVPVAGTFATTRLLVERAGRIRVLRTREGMPVESFVVDISDEAGDVPLHAAGGGRATRAPRRLALG